MGSRNPERDTQRLLGTHAGKELFGRCPTCKAERRFAIAPLARKYGGFTHVSYLSKRMRCEQCGRRGIPLHFIDWDQRDEKDYIEY